MTALEMFKAHGPDHGPRQLLQEAPRHVRRFADRFLSRAPQGKGGGELE